MTPVEIVRLYYRDVWSEHRVERIATLCADPIQRHDPHGDYALTHAQQQQRILERAPKRLHFQVISAHGDGEFATVIWQVTSDVSDYRNAGIEVLKVIDEKIVEVWNATRERPWVVL